MYGSAYAIGTYTSWWLNHDHLGLLVVTTIGVVNFVPGCTAAYTWLHATGMQVNFLSFNQIAEIKRKNVNQLHSQKHHHFIINDNQTTEHLHIIIEVAISQEPN